MTTAELAQLRDRILFTIDFIAQVADLGPMGEWMRSTTRQAFEAGHAAGLRQIWREIEAITRMLTPAGRDLLDAGLRERFGFDRKADRGGLTRAARAILRRGRIGSAAERKRLEDYDHMLEASGDDVETREAIAELLDSGELRTQPRALSRSVDSAPEGKRERRGTRQRWVPGTIVRIPLDDGESAFGQMLVKPELAFFDLRRRDTPAAEDVVAHHVIFRLWVSNNAWSTGRWPKLGKAPIAPALQEEVPRFTEVIGRPGEFKLWDRKLANEPATAEQCQELEVAAVWFPEHVEQRLRDRFAGRPNAVAESLRAPRR